MSTRRRLLIVLLGISVLIAIVVYSVYATRKRPVEVQTGRVEKLPELVAKVTASGEIKPKEYVELQAEISGVITQLYVKEGDLVGKGDLLVRIDPAQTEGQARAQEALVQAALMEAANADAQIALQEANLSRDRANLRASEADVAKARQALDFADSNFKRKQDLFEQNLISRDLYDSAKNDRVAAESGLLSAEARLEQARAALEVANVVLSQVRNSKEAAQSRVEQNRAVLGQALDSLAKTVIRSPLTGVITQLNVEVGERAVPGTLNNPAATIMIIADLSVIEAEIEVNETDIVAVQLNQPAVVRVDALPEQPLQGSVTEIGNSAIQKQTSQEAKEFKVSVRLESPPPSLRPGLSCTADITTAVRHDVLAIPIQALVVREFAVDENGSRIDTDSGTIGKERERKEFEGVFVTQGGGATFRPVKTGIYGETRVQVLSGVDQGVEIVTGSYKALRELQEGDKIKIETAP